MLFSSVTFLYYFLPLVLICYFAVPYRWKNYVLLVFSLIFYFCGEPVYTLLLVISSLSDFMHSLYIEKHRGTSKAKRALISSIVINLLMLGFFKYTDFFIENINLLFGSHIPELNIPLPIGISFFTFQTMSYTIDVYRGDVHAEKNLATMATYVCLFPQLVAGPIVRYQTIAEELQSREISLPRVSKGLVRFCVGLAKKVLIANNLGALFQSLDTLPQPTMLSCWVGVISFALQIYFDFSGYSDMAIGLGEIFGFSFLENFNYPFIAKSAAEFWRRWHISLGSWFRDYVYIPLGGNRVSPLKWLRNTFIVWFITGFWHGASWNYVIWGLYFGLFLVLEKWVWGKFFAKHAVLGHVYTLLITMVSFAIFNADTKYGIWNTISGMFGWSGIPVWSTESVYYLLSGAVLLLIAVVGATPLPKMLWQKFLQFSAKVRPDRILVPIFCLAALTICTAFLIDNSFNPFLYFRF